MIYFNQWVGDCLDTSVDESLEDFKGDTQQRYMTIALRVPQWLLWLKIATTSALLQIFGILSWRMQELNKSQNQDLRADPAWSTNSGKWNPITETFLATGVSGQQQILPA